MWDFLLELGRQYGLLVVVIGLVGAGMVVIIAALWKRTHDQAKLIESGGSAPKLDAVTKGLEDAVGVLGKQSLELASMRESLGRLPVIEELLETRYEARIANLEAQVRELIEENRELQRKWREQASSDLREMLEHVDANRDAVSKIAELVSDMRDLLRR